MNASINKSVVTLNGKLKEEGKMQVIIDIMMGEIEMCLIESFGSETGHGCAEMTLCYNSDDYTVAEVKESYADAKRACK